MKQQQVLRNGSPASSATPRPWSISQHNDTFGERIVIASGDPADPEWEQVADIRPTKLGQYNAQFIVTACNAHQALYEALSAATDEDRLREFVAQAVRYSNESLGGIFDNVFPEIRAALALADAAQEGEANASS